MDVSERVRAWREAKCASHCPRCPINCCEGRLNPRLDRMEAFADLPIVPPEPRPLGPYVVRRGGEHYLMGRCPHLQAGACAIYADPSRPSECHEYPLQLRGGTLHAETSCWIFQDEVNLAAVTALANGLGLDLEIH